MGRAYSAAGSVECALSITVPLSLSLIFRYLGFGLAAPQFKVAVVAVAHGSGVFGCWLCRVRLEHHGAPLTVSYFQISWIWLGCSAVLGLCCRCGAWVGRIRLLALSSAP